MLTISQKGVTMTLEVQEMITYVKMKNFMSFKDVLFDLGMEERVRRNSFPFMVKMVVESLILLPALIC